VNDARKNYLKSRKYYKNLLKERISNYIYGTIEIIIALIFIMAHIQLVYLVIDSEDTADRINKCLESNTMNYCQNNIK